jgi:hypothetical protein
VPRSLNNGGLGSVPLSNSLTNLAVRIKAEHTAIRGLSSDSVERAMAAGDNLDRAAVLQETRRQVDRIMALK